MADHERERRTAQVADAGALLDTVLGEVARGKTRLVLQQDGKDVAALISAADLARLEYLDRQRAERFKVIEEVWARNADLDPEEAERDIAEAIAEMRAEARANVPATPRT